MNVLEQLREMTIIVVDTGDIESIKKHHPRDATTNPSLLLAAAKLSVYKPLVEDAIQNCSLDVCDPKMNIRPCYEKLVVNFAREILTIIPGRVSIEVDASLSFDIEETVNTARRMITMIEKENIDRHRILIKIASTWEGIKAAEQLEKEGIHCNLTLLFSFAQAVACAEAKVTLISPFVGRILDWYKVKQGIKDIQAKDDPGVISVTQIYNYYKKFGYQTGIMGASFRNIGEIVELAGCDLLTISPKLLEELENQKGKLERKLDVESARTLDLEKIFIDEKSYRWMLNEDAMATEKLAEGIRNFHADLNHLAEFMREFCSKKKH